MSTRLCGPRADSVSNIIKEAEDALTVGAQRMYVFITSFAFEVKLQALTKLQVSLGCLSDRSTSTAEK